MTQQTVTDERGSYLFDALPAGAYLVEASVPGFAGKTNIRLVAAATVDALIELIPETVENTVDVTAAPDALRESSAQNVTLTSSTVQSAPNRNERFDDLLPLVPGVVRGPDGLLSLKGASSTQAGWLVNSANVTDPATGAKAMNLPIDVVSNVQVVSNPYDPEYGRFTGAVSNVETRTGSFDSYHFSIQNLFPRPRNRDGAVVGIEAFTPRSTITGPLLGEKLAFTQSVEYRYVRTPVNSLPPLQRDTKLESVDSFTQLDMHISQKQTATVSFGIFPQKIEYLGLNAFTPQESTPNFHQRGYEGSLQHNYATDSGNLLTSRFSYKKVSDDLFANGADPYRLLIETTEGGFFNRQERRTDSVEWQEVYQLGPKHFAGNHDLKLGLDYLHSAYDGNQRFSPADIVGVSGFALERIQFSAPTSFSIPQNETASFVGDHWTVRPWLAFDFGVRFDRDSVTDGNNFAPRVGMTVALTRDRKTLLRAGAGMFYDRVPLIVPSVPLLPERTLLMLTPGGVVINSTPYRNEISGGLRNPRNEMWNVELDRQVSSNFLLRAAYQQRNTVHNQFVDPRATPGDAVLSVSSGGRGFYRELQLTGRYQVRHQTLNVSYVRSRGYGDLNDVSQFFGNDPQAVIQPNQRALLNFDAPNRILTWGQISAPCKLTVMPVVDLHNGFPYSTEDQYRNFVGPRNSLRLPFFSSVDLQVQRYISLPHWGKERKAKVGVGVFNLFNHFNPREVQMNVDSHRFGSYFDGVPRMIRGKFVLEF